MNEKKEQMGGFTKKPFFRQSGQTSGPGQRIFRKNSNYVPKNNNNSGKPNQFGGSVSCTKCCKMGHTVDVCRLGTNACYYCGKLGHNDLNCISRLSATPPNNQGIITIAARPPAQPKPFQSKGPSTVNKGRKFAKGRAYAITFEQAQDPKEEEGFDVDVLQGIVYLNEK